MQSAYSLEIKSIDSSGTFEGLASVYGNADEGGDIVEHGAFTKTLASSKDRPLLWQHRDPIGTVTLRDSTAGLIAKGKLVLGTTLGRDAYELVKAGVVDGMSIGYSVINADRDGEYRRLLELKLYEVSLVTFPMNQAARVTTVKSQIRAEEEKALRALEYLREEVLGALGNKNNNSTPSGKITVIPPGIWRIT